MSTTAWQDGAPIPKRKADLVAGFELGPVIGIGTYGEVRCARKISTGQRVAIKIVDLSRFNSDVEALMVKEMQMLKEVEHENCIRLLEVHEKVAYSGTWCSRCACTEYSGHGECQNCAPHSGTDHSGFETRKVMFLVEELAAGGELFGILMQTGKLTEPIARYYFKQLIDGVEHLHSRGIAHRDLKPENLVLDAHFQLKIVDFGLAAHFSEARPLLHSGVGSQPYSAPEVYYSKELFAQQGYSGPPADLWSCAVVLFVLLTGRPPFVRPLARNFGALRRCKHFINLLRGRGYGSMSPAARDLLMTMFQPNPHDRPTIADIRAHAWFKGPVPDQETLAKIMSEKSYEVWRHQDKTQMIEVLEKVRRDLTVTPRLCPIESPDDPFAHANVHISLLSLDETEDPVRRCLPFVAVPDNVASLFNASSQSSYVQDDPEIVDAAVLNPKHRVQATAQEPVTRTGHTELNAHDLALVRESSMRSTSTEGENEAPCDAAAAAAAAAEHEQPEEDEGADEEKENCNTRTEPFVVCREGQSEDDERVSETSAVAYRTVSTCISPSGSQEGSDREETDDRAFVVVAAP